MPKRKLAELLAETETWQTWCGLTYPDALANAKLIDGSGGTKRIFYPTIDARDGLGDLYDRMPLAVITNGNAWQQVTKAGGAGNYLLPSGQLRLIVADRDRYDGALEASQREFENRLGDLFDDLKALAGRSDRLGLETITQQVPPQMPPEEEQHARPDKLWWSCVYLLDWR